MIYIYIYIYIDVAVNTEYMTMRRTMFSVPVFQYSVFSIPRNYKVTYAYI